MFRLLGLHPGPDFTIPAAASLAGVSIDEAGRTLAALTRVHLVAEHVPGRFEFHDLLRAYAAERAQAEEDEPRRRDAVLRMLDTYLRTACAAGLLLYPHRDPITLEPAQPGAEREHLADASQALAWFDAEHRVLLAAIGQAASDSLDTRVWQLAWTLETFFYRRGHLHDWATTQRAALAAAQRVGDAVGQAHACRGIGAASIESGAYQDARIHSARALDVYRKLGDRVGQGRAHADIARALRGQGHLRDALRHGEQALELFRAEDNPAGQAQALNAIGWNYACLGDYEEAIMYGQEALILNRKIGDRQSEPPIWDTLGYAHYHLGRHAEAATCYHRSLELFDELGYRYRKAAVLGYWADALLAAGDLQAARDAWRQALAILDDLQHPDAAQVRAKLRSR
jgi:tetratricopeptide (TPR) repeat protein